MKQVIDNKANLDTLRILATFARSLGETSNESTLCPENSPGASLETTVKF